MDQKTVDLVRVVRDENGQWRIRLESSNGEIVMTSEQYANQSWARALAGELSGRLDATLIEDR